MTFQISQPPYNARDGLLRAWPDIFPGMDRVVLLFRQGDGAVGGEEMIETPQGYRFRPLIPKGIESRMAEIFSEPPGYNWLHKDQLPFEEFHHSGGQLLIFSEQQHVVLLLRLRQYKNETDCFYLFFREDQSNFGISRLQGTLDTSRKALIGSIVYRLARLFYQSNNEFHSYLREFTNVTKSLFREEKQQESCDERLLNWIRHWAENYLEQLTAQTAKRWILTSEAVSKLVDAPDFMSANRALQRAARFALMLHADDSHEYDLVLESRYIVFESSDERAGDSSSSRPMPAGRIVKTIGFLDKLEQAALNLSAQGEDITGAAVGQMMDRPITAPAISDALRKNRTRILRLLNEHGSRWPTIRKQFRPLINLVEKSRDMRNTG